MNAEKNKDEILYPQLAIELQAMVDIDQEMRERSHNEEGFWDNNVDVKNTERMKEVVSQIGFPTISMVGTDGSLNAWLLVQHADHDIEFQKKCLKLMKLVPTGEIEQTRIAYLEDRIRINQKQKQLYGTQFTQENGRHVPQPIEDEEHVDERRAQMGMNTLADQIKLMYEKYGVPRIEE